MDQNRNQIALPEGLRLVVKAALAVFVSAVFLVFANVDDMDQRIEWLKAFATFATPLVIAFGLWFTYEALVINKGTLEQTRRSVENAADQLELERSTRVDELFYKACHTLDTSQSESGKIGALSILENISQEYANRYRPCIEVISGFIRSESEDLPDLDSDDFDLDSMPESLFTAWSILTRRRGFFGDELEGDLPLNLQGAKCFGLMTSRADFCGTRFRGAQFRNVHFVVSRFAYAEFFGASMYNVRFEECDLRNVEFNEDSTTRFCKLIYQRAIRIFSTQRCITELNSETGIYSARRVQEDSTTVRSLLRGIDRAPAHFNHLIQKAIGEELVERLNPDEYPTDAEGLGGAVS